MSAVRRLDARSQARKTQSSPYARPQAQNSRWSLRSFLEPIRRRVFGETTESEESIGRGRQIERSPSPLSVGIPEEPSYSSVYTYHSSGTEPPRSPSKSASPKRPPPREGITPTATMENVLDWLTDATGCTLKRDEVHTVVGLIHKGIPSERTVTGSLSQSVGRPLGAIEVEGMVSLLRKQMPRASSEPFRFKTATPSRDTTPTATTPGPRKMLTKNPNGTYRWQGAGSSKVTPRRNRYSSPAFGTSNVTPAKSKGAMGMSGSDTSVADGKRRKVESGDSSYFAPSATSSPQPAPSTNGGLPFPISSSPNSRSASNATTTTAPPTKITIPPAPVVAPPRLRTPTFKPSLPSQPSPLRNAWTGSPDSSVEEISVGNLSPPKHQPTQAASFMSELIEKVTPAKKPDDLTNPYQTASPIAKVGPPRRSTRRTRPTRPAISDVQEEKEEEEKVEEKTRDLPPEAIIAATLPKGSKRSRPPANLEKSAAAHRSPSPVTNGSGKDTEMHDYTVEEVDEDRTNKKQKGLNGLASPPSRTNDIAIEEVDESEVTSEGAPGQSLGNGSATNGFSSRPFGGFKPTAIPSRPSKLRFSYQAEVSAPSSPTSQPDAESASKSSTMDLDAPPPPTLSTNFTFTPKLSSSAPAPATTSTFASTLKPATSLDPKSQALSTPTQNLQVFVFAVPSTSIPPKHFAAAEKAKAQSSASLPTFDLSAPTAQAGPSKTSEAPKSTGFNWAAAGMKPAAPAASQWTCALCSLQNPDSAKDCTVCEAPRPGAKAEEAPKSTGFNWAAAGMKAPTSGSSKWKCAVCDLENPDEVKDQCTVCETPRPGAKPEPPKSTGGFNWAAAGAKPPPTASANQWTCSLCALKNSDSVTKCTICDNPR